MIITITVIIVMIITIIAKPRLTLSLGAYVSSPACPRPRAIL